MSEYMNPQPGKFLLIHNDEESPQGVIVVNLDYIAWVSIGDSHLSITTIDGETIKADVSAESHAQLAEYFIANALSFGKVPAHAVAKALGIAIRKRRPG